MIKLNLPIAPVAWERVKRGSYGQAYVPTKTRVFKNTVGILAKAYCKKPLEGPLRLIINFYIVPPKRRTRTYPHVRPDLDNYIKAIKDGLNGVVWLDDAQIVDLRALKSYEWETGQGRIELEIWELE